MKNLIEKYNDDCVKFYQKLIQVPSINGLDNEKEIVKVIVKEAEKLNLSYKIISKDKDRPNIFIGNNFENDKELLLVAHLDTVPVGDEKQWNYSPFSGKIIDNKIYGRGALDCKGGIAISIYLLKILEDLGYKNIAKFVGCADEESGADSDLGLKYVLKKGLKAKGAVYTYGSDGISNTLTIGHRGLIRIKLICQGETTHSGSLEWQEKTKGENAIDGLIDLLNEIRKLNYQGDNDFFPNYKFNLTTTLISGGEGESIVPGQAEAMLDVRTLPNHQNNKIISDIKEIAKRLSKNKRKYDIKIKINVPAAITDKNSIMVKITRNLMEKRSKIKNPLLKGSGPTNEGHMLIKKNIPTIIGFGPIGDGFHSYNEYAKLSSVKNSLELLTELAINLNKK